MTGNSISKIDSVLIGPSSMSRRPTAVKRLPGSDESVRGEFLRQQIRLIMLFGKEPGDLPFIDLGQVIGPPDGFLVLVDQAGAHPFAKIRLGAEVKRHIPFTQKDLEQRQALAAGNLFEDRPGGSRRAGNVAVDRLLEPRIVAIPGAHAAIDGVNIRLYRQATDDVVALEDL